MRGATVEVVKAMKIVLCPAAAMRAFAAPYYGYWGEPADPVVPDAPG